MQKTVEAILTVSDEELVAGMKFYGQTMKMVVEPTGCLSLAGMRKSGLDLKGKKIGIIISGGNVDLDRYADLISK